MVTQRSKRSPPLTESHGLLQSVIVHRHKHNNSANPFHALRSYLLTIQFNIILNFTDTPSGLLPLDYLTKICIDVPSNVDGI